MNDNQQVRVVIRCLTFNHAPYIRQCLEGFVMQRTDFKFVVLIHDDASTDGTADIIREYAAKYPDVFQPIIQTENQYSKQDGSLARILNEAVRSISPRYIAMCEGDDYWTDSHKLQKQIDFLESHPEYSMCFHNVEVHKAYGSEISIDRDFFGITQSREYGASEIITKWVVPTCSVVFRSECLQKIPKNPNFKMGDNVLFLTCAFAGKVYCINERMAVYRRNDNGVSVIDMGEDQEEKLIVHYKALQESFPVLSKDLDDFIVLRYVSLLKIQIRKKQKRVWKTLNRATKDYGIRFYSSLLQETIKQIKK